MSSLKNQGVRLALDDFGTGFSSLAHIRSLPFDIIKVDRSFVANLGVKRESAAIIRAVTTLAAALSVPVCVEGIENETAFKAVMRLGCTIGQGWYFGKPMPAEQTRETSRGALSVERTDTIRRRKRLIENSALRSFVPRRDERSRAPSWRV